MPTALPQHLLARLPYPDLYDPRTGIVRALEPAAVPEHFPPSFSLVTARLADVAPFAPWPVDPAGAGYAYADPDAVLGAALGEAVERYCGNLVPPDLVRGTHEELAAAGTPALDPTTVALFSAQQHTDPAFPAVPMSRDLVLEWATGRDLSTGESVLVPAPLVWPSYLTAPGAPPARSGGWVRPLTNPVIQAGLAAGPTVAAAVDNGLREVVERDAMTLSWSGGAGVVELTPPDWLAAFSRGPRGALITRYLGLSSAFAVPVVAALVHDAVTDRLAMGIGVYGDPITAAVKAHAEALQLHLVLADYDDPRGAFAAAAAGGGSPLAPWRSDRAYGSAYRADRRDVVDYACHLQLHLDPAVRAAFTAELAALVREVRPLTAMPSKDVPTLQLVRAAGMNALMVDVTTPDVRGLGVYVVRALVPGTYSNAPLGLPFLGGARLAAARSAAVGPLPTTPWPH